MEEFIQAIKNAPRDVNVELRRNLGTRTYPAHVRIYVESVIPEELRNVKREKLFLIASLICVQNESRGKQLPYIIATDYMNEHSTKNVYRSTLALLDNPGGVDDRFIRDISVLIDRIVRDGNTIDSLSLLKDIVYWGDSTKHRWETIIARNCDKKFLE